LNIFTGPLYYIIKLVSVIKYAEMLKQHFPAYHFVPVYWMATEDHDLEEINHFYLWGKTLKWDAQSEGAVGRMNPHSLESVIEELEKLTANSPNGKGLIDLFKSAYGQHNTLAGATRYLVNELFKQYGLVVVDGDDPILKKALIPVFEMDIFETVLFKAINHSFSALQKKYKLPVTPREINVFYLEAHSRERIVLEGGHYQVLNSTKHWTESELKAELHTHPEHFSPNVVMRPMYQELVLPNLTYIGGNNEIAYWLELRESFLRANVFFPQLLVRDSALFIGKKAAKDLDQLKLKPEDLFLSLPDLKFKFYETNMLGHAAEQAVSAILGQYDALKDDLKGLPADLAAMIVKQMNIQVKEVKKWKNDIHNKQMEIQEKNVIKLEKLYAAFYPDGELQERHDNFMPFYLQNGAEWLEMLKKEFDPLQAVCHIFIEE
jgi:bacillithiol biosynthesis cysteine-adding enzyme BshC